MPKDSWQQIGDITQRVLEKIAPVTYIVHMPGDLAVRLERKAMDEGNNAEAIIARAVRAYISAAR